MALLHAYQFYSGLVTTVGSPPASLYTVPAGYRIIIRSATLRNLAGSAQVFKLFQDGVILFTSNLAAGGGIGDSADVRRWVVLTPGQIIKANVTVAAGCYVVVSGSIYTI